MRYRVHVRARALVLIAAIAGACGGGPKRAAAPPEHRDNREPPAAPVVDRAVLADVAAGLEEVLGAMAQIAGGTDCPAMGAQLGELFARSQPLFELARAQEQEPEAARLLAAELEARAGTVAPLVERIGVGLERCRGEPAVIDAIRAMPVL